MIEKLENNRMNIALMYSYNPKQMVGVPLIEEQFFLAFTRDCLGAEPLLPFAISIDEVVDGKKFTVDKNLYQTIPEEMHLILGDLYNSDPDLESYISKIPYSHCRVINSRHRGVFYDLMLMGMGSLFVIDVIASIKQHRSRVNFVNKVTPKGVTDTLKIVAHKALQVYTPFSKGVRRSNQVY